MTTDYDKIADRYGECVNLPISTCVEMYSLQKLVGDVKGKKVLDVACGEGRFTRLLRDAGAAEVIGFDISERMINLAREQEADNPLGITYLVEDARTAAVPHQDFDLVVAAWLLSCARDRAELRRMCEGLASRIKPGGRFVAVTTNPEVYSFKRPLDYQKYGYEKIQLADHAFEGAPIKVTLRLEDTSLDFEDYYLPMDACRTELTGAGFRDFAVHSPEALPQPVNSSDDHFWDDFVNHPVFVLIDCTKT
ncbi:class I SAM-dependent methyltransferase [Mycobacterium sp.]|uniref:class I SAM-dependent methyltransferase n=1 Tax=Mycobacterium sp. TaxID=1785 RepID=UPI003BAD1E25